MTRALTTLRFSSKYWTLTCLLSFFSLVLRPSQRYTRKIDWFWSILWCNHYVCATISASLRLQFELHSNAHILHASHSSKLASQPWPARCIRATWFTRTSLLAVEIWELVALRSRLCQLARWMMMVNQRPESHWNSRLSQRERCCWLR